MKEMKNKIGITLFTFYILQFLLSLKWSFLENLQEIESYKKWSGLVLIIFILSQWYLSIMRMNKEFNAEKKEKYTNLHKWIGVLLPIVFYFHSTEFGFGVLMLLSLVFLINIAIGFVNTYDLLEKHPKFFNVWLVGHVFLSVAVLVFSAVHVWLVYLYN